MASVVKSNAFLFDPKGDTVTEKAPIAKKQSQSLYNR